MPIPTFTGLPPEPTFTDLVNKVNRLTQEMTNLMLNLDSLNVVSLTADHIDAGTIDANIVTIRSDLTAGAYVQINGSGMVINNGSFNTFTADINGNVTMTSALIQSSTGYPKVVMDPASDLFGAYTSASKYINIEANDSGDPLLFFNDDPNYLTRISLKSGLFSIGTFSELLMSSTDDMRISTTGSGTNITIDPKNDVILPSWSRVYSSGNIETLQDALNDKADSGLSTGSAGAVSLNGGIPIGTALAVSGGGSVTWTGINVPSHTHIQN